MLGSSLAIDLEKKFQIFTTGSSKIKNSVFKNYFQFDLKKEDYTDLINWAKPEIIIHCAALTDGNECQNDPHSAIVVNGLSLQRFLKYTNSSVKIIYISTDAVFGNNNFLSKEADYLNPENVYGKSKELGEFFLKNSGRNYCILRTTIVGLNLFKSKKESFVEWIIRSSVDSHEIGLFDDVLFSPISIWDLSNEINDIIISKNVKGIYHLTGSEVTSKYKFGISLLKELKLNTKKIQKKSILSFEERAGRAMDQSLDTNLYERTFDRNLPSIEETIKSIKNNINNEKYKIRK